MQSISQAKSRFLRPLLLRKGLVMFGYSRLLEDLKVGGEVEGHLAAYQPAS